jgi:hypothetical protein
LGAQDIADVCSDFVRRRINRAKTAKPPGRIDATPPSAQLPRETKKYSRHFYIFRKCNLGERVFISTQYIDVDCWLSARRFHGRAVFLRA